MPKGRKEQRRPSVLAPAKKGELHSLYLGGGKRGGLANLPLTRRELSGVRSGGGRQKPRGGGKRSKGKKKKGGDRLFNTKEEPYSLHLEKNAAN